MDQPNNIMHGSLKLIKDILRRRPLFVWSLLAALNLLNPWPSSFFPLRLWESQNLKEYERNFHVRRSLSLLLTASLIYSSHIFSLKPWMHAIISSILFASSFALFSLFSIFFLPLSLSSHFFCWLFVRQEFSLVATGLSGKAFFIKEDWRTRKERGGERERADEWPRKGEVKKELMELLLEFAIPMTRIASNWHF